jgi:hypothetical protein
VLRFDGGDWMRFASLTSALANTSDGAWTVAVLLKPAVLSTFQGYAYLCSAGPVTEAGLSRENIANSLQTDVSGYGNKGDALSSTTETYIAVAAKGAGTVPVNYHRYVRSTTTWSGPTSTGGANLADQIAATMLEIGTWQGGSDTANAWIGLVAFWEGEMSTTNVQHLDDSWQTSDWYSNAHGTPTALIELNVAAASAVDLIGNATSLSVTGAPTLDSGETLASFNFNGTGAAATAPAVPQRRVYPMALARMHGPKRGFLAFPFPSTPTAVGGATFPQALDANVTTTATFQLRTNKNVTATATSTATITRQVGKAVTATVTATANILKRVGKTLTANATVTATLATLKVVLLALTATVTSTASIVKQVGKPLTYTVTSTATIVKRGNKSLTANATVTATLATLKVILKALTATVTSTATMTLRVNKLLTATVTSTASLVKRVNKNVTANATVTATLTTLKVILKAMTATVTSSATMQRRVNKIVSATVTTTATIQRRINKTLATTATVAGNIVALFIPPGAAIVAAALSVVDRITNALGITDTNTTNVSVSDTATTTVVVSDAGTASAAVQDSTGANVRIDDVAP